MPDRDEILRAIEQTPDDLSRRDLVRSFGLKGRERTQLKRVLRELKAEGAFGERRSPRAIDGRGRVAVLEVIEIDQDGELLARPTSETDELPDAIAVLPGRAPAPGIGDRILAQVSWRDEAHPEARVMRVLRSEQRRVLGVLRRAPDGFRLQPVGEDARRELAIRASDALGAGPGELVLVERAGGRPLGLPSARVVECLGRPDDPGAVSLIAARTYDLPILFPPEAEALAKAARPVPLGTREDLRVLPLVTIDGADARDFDDAVHATPDDDPKNPEGWQIVVAIADVAHYVRPGNPLDREARRRGNSVYFPDRVLPMLPEALSNGLCSLRPDEDRACIAVRMWFDRRGRKLRHRFVRALMRSRARLTYEQVQAAQDGAPDAATAPLRDAVIRPLYGAFGVLAEARRERGTLDLDLPEAEIRLDAQGRPCAVLARPRLDSHRLIEEFMIAANVAAAETLDRADVAGMYRLHDRPDPIKLEALAQLLETLGMRRGPSALSKPKDLARLLEQLRGHELSPVVSQLVLRAQSQAAYGPNNIGHFGLNLRLYAHFTSPIRRYADLIVHRALLSVLKLGEGGFETVPSLDDLQTLGVHLSRCERRAMEAERSAMNRFVALLLGERIGSAFSGTVSSVHRFGLFVRLDETMAEGLVPVSTLGAEPFAHDAARHALIGRVTGTVLALGCRVRVELTDVDPLTGQLAFRLLEHTPGAAAVAAERAWRRQPRRGRTPRGRTRR